jgi:hypothetical protein
MKIDDLWVDKFHGVLALLPSHEGNSPLEANPSKN